METIIDPVDKSLLEKELTHDNFLRETNNGNNEIYVITALDSPNIMHEIGRLREISFRDAGGGTGLSEDIDEFDVIENPYKQLIVWDPRHKEITGGYRFLHGNDARINADGQPNLATTELFRFSDTFLKDYLPYTIELGRSFVQPNYQPTFDLKKGMYSLDNLWDGLGAIIIEHPELKYYFGKFTMYPRFNILARDLILYFLGMYFPDKEKLIEPIEPLELVTDVEKLKHTFYGNSYKENYKILIQQVRAMKENIPPLVNAYMNLSSSMKFSGTCINHFFGEVEESAILISIDDIYDIKKERHISTYKKKNN